MKLLRGARPLGRIEARRIVDAARQAV